MTYGDRLTTYGAEHHISLSNSFPSREPKVVDGDPAEVEGKLLDVQNAIEYVLEIEYFRDRS